MNDPFYRGQLRWREYATTMERRQLEEIDKRHAEAKASLLRAAFDLHIIRARVIGRERYRTRKTG